MAEELCAHTLILQINDAGIPGHCIICPRNSQYYWTPAASTAMSVTSAAAQKKYLLYLYCPSQPWSFFQCDL